MVGERIAMSWKQVTERISPLLLRGNIAVYTRFCSFREIVGKFSNSRKSKRSLECEISRQARSMAICKINSSLLFPARMQSVSAS